MNGFEVRDTMAELDLAAELLPLIVGLLILAIVVVIVVL